MSRRKKIIISLCIAILILAIGYFMLVKYYQCNPLPDRLLYWKLENADGQSVEMFGQIVNPGYDQDGNLDGYSQVMFTCKEK